MDWLAPTVGVGFLVAIALAIFTYALGHSAWIGPYERGVLMRGAEARELLPGKHRVRPGATLQRVDMRTQPVHIPAQEIPTSEGVHARYGIVVELVVCDPKLYVLSAQNALSNIYRDIQLTTREAIAPLTCDDVRARPAEVGEAIRDKAAASASNIGITLEKVSLLDIQLPTDLKRVIAATEIEKRNAQLQLDKARNEIATLRAMANAASLLKDNPQLETLRRLRALEDAITHSKGNVQVHIGDER